MDNELLSTQIKLVNELHSTTSLEKIIIKMQPLIKKYVRKLYFLEKEDASQELTLALIEAVYHISTYTSEAMCLTYLQKSVINKYYYLCKLNIKFTTLNDTFVEVPENVPYIESFQNIEFFIDVNESLKNKNEKERFIVKNILFHGLSDKEISLKLGVSRQYVNRVKKKILKEIY